jgi:hypothetical protein
MLLNQIGKDNAPEQELPNRKSGQYLLPQCSESDKFVK